MTEGIQRRLVAILAADVVGYSRLMGEDEAGTMARLEGLKAEILIPLIAQHHGRVVKQNRHHDPRLVPIQRHATRLEPLNICVNLEG